MTLESIYFIASIAAALGVIASLVFVGLQMRQNTVAIRLESASHYQMSLGNVELFIAQNPEFAALLVKGRAGQELTEPEKLRLWVFYGNVMRTWQNVHHQFTVGALDKALWDGNRARLERVLQEDMGLVAAWRDDRAQYTQEYNHLIEKILDAQGAPSAA